MPQDAIVIIVGVDADDPAKATGRVLKRVTEEFDAGGLCLVELVIGMGGGVSCDVVGIIL